MFPLNILKYLDLNYKGKYENKDISILIEIRVNHDQIHQKKNNWFATIFFLLDIATKMDCLF